MITLASVLPSITIQLKMSSIPERPIVVVVMPINGYQDSIWFISINFHLGPWYEWEIPIKWNRMQIRVDTSISLHSLFYQDNAPYFKNDNINQLWDFQAETIDLLWVHFHNVPVTDALKSKNRKLIMLESELQPRRQFGSKAGKGSRSPAVDYEGASDWTKMHKVYDLIRQIYPLNHFTTRKIFNLRHQRTLSPCLRIYHQLAS